MLEHILFTDQERTRCVNTIAALCEEMDQWKKTYERHDNAFMNISKQPAWGHMDELVQIVTNIKYTIAEEKTIQTTDICALNAWLNSSKASTIDAYLLALRGAYAYGTAASAEQSCNLDQPYPEMAKAMLTQLEHAPNRLKAFAWEMLSDVRRKYPFIAAQLNYATTETRETHLKLVSARVA